MGGLSVSWKKGCAVLCCAVLCAQVFNGTTQDVEFTIELDQLESWIKDVQRIFKMDLWENGKAR
jgi:hypothetical protein